MGDVANQVSGDRVKQPVMAFLLALGLVELVACGSVTAIAPDADAGGAGGTEDAGAAGATGAAGGPADAALELGGETAAPVPDAPGPELAPAGSPACSGSPTGTATYDQRCGDAAGVRCVTNCTDTSGHSHPDHGPACLEPGAPATGGIPVLCVSDCSACPAP
jgi:hypothetical protein